MRGLKKPPLTPALSHEGRGDSIAAIGVDNGGTWIRLQALNHDGHPIRSLKKPSPALDDLPAFIKRVLRRWKGKPGHLAVGSRGVWSSTQRQALKKKLKTLAAKVTVMSDVEAAWLAAFGNGRTGIIVIAGTGSIAYARDTDGCARRAGGLGPWKGDEGSAFWIGKRWSELGGHYEPTQVRATAGLARKILRNARRGDRRARRVAIESQDHLADLVKDLCENLHWKAPVPVSWSGSVLDDPWFRKGFFASVRRKMNRRFHFIRRSTEPANAVARYVLNYARS